jgi:predicted ATP-grasp superfamily ATP-dependent carboligase
MATALVAELAALPGVSVRLAWAAGLRPPDLPAEIRKTVPGEPGFPSGGEALEGCDAVWPIAPESGGILERDSRAVLAAGRTLLGSSPEAVRTAASKCATAAALAARGVPVVPTSRAGEGIPEWGTGWVLKPDRGEGGQGVRYFPRRPELQEALGSLERPGEWVIQPFVPGRGASLSLVMGKGTARAVSLNRQPVTWDPEGAHLQGVEPGPPPGPEDGWVGRVQGLAEAIPGLWGFVGVDFVDTPQGPVVLEVNPRLTTAFAVLPGKARAGVAKDVLNGGNR